MSWVGGPGLARDNRDHAAQFIGRMAAWARELKQQGDSKGDPDFLTQTTVGMLALIFQEAMTKQFGPMSQQRMDAIHRRYLRMVEAGGVNPETTQALLYGVLISMALGAIKLEGVTSAAVDLSGLPEAPE